MATGFSRSVDSCLCRGSGHRTWHKSGATHALAAAPDGLLSAPTAIARLIQTAGTTHDELERLRLLRQLEARTDLNTTLRADLAKLLPVVDDWANGKSRARRGHQPRGGKRLPVPLHHRPGAPGGGGPVHPPELSARFAAAPHLVSSTADAC